MSYLLRASQLVIRPRDEIDALEALQEDFGDVDGVSDADSLDEAMDALGWELERDDEDVVSGLCATDMDGEADAFFAIGPFVKRGSFIFLSWEDEEDIVGWVFTGRACHEWQPDEEELEELDEDELDDYEVNLEAYDELDGDFEDEEEDEPERDSRYDDEELDNEFEDGDELDEDEDGDEDEDE